MNLEKLWIISAPDPETVLRISSALNISEAVAKLIVARGYSTPEEALEFINADFDLLENPFKICDMEKAVVRLRMAVDRKEKVFVAGDRDTDGVTSTTLLVNLLHFIGIKAGWKVPTPADGYGLSLPAVDAAVAFGSSLIVTVDCGIRDFAGIDYAREKGIDVVVIDHHEAAATLPAAWAIVDPKRGDCAYPFKGLSACGVAFKFAQAYLMAEDKEFFGKKMVVFDTETTGMRPDKDEIIEIAAIKSRNGVEISRFESFIKPEHPVPKSLTEIHGISDRMLASAPPAADVIAKFLDFAGDATLVAHKASFDTNFLKETAKRCLGRKVNNPVIDTLTEARSQFPGTDHSLGALSTRFNFKHDVKHRAMADVAATFLLYKKIVGVRNARLQSFLKNQLDLVALSTLADVVPLQHENRVLVKRGLEALRRSTRPGIAALRDALVRGETLSAKDVAWSIVPVVNSAGRMGRADVAARLLMAASAEEAAPLVAELSAMNVERKQRVKTNMEAVVAMLEETFDPDVDVLALALVKNLEHGVTGILANRIVNDVGRPTVILIDDESGVCAGTTRSIEGFDITAALEKIAHLTERFGGHAGAAGLAVRTDKIPEFKEALSEIIRREVSPELLKPRLRIDAEIRPEDVGGKILDELAMLEPTGHGNEAPIFCVRGVEVTEARRMGDSSQHLKLILRGSGGSDAASIEAVAWNVHKDRLPSVGDRLDVAFGVERNEWRGRVRVQCLIEDYRTAVML
ncbi:MAG: single-stranded-DNA-specific exonuclease RecJ [Candidatus Hydrogenedentota bacterium]